MRVYKLSVSCIIIAASMLHGDVRDRWAGMRRVSLEDRRDMPPLWFIDLGQIRDLTK